MARAIPAALFRGHRRQPMKSDPDAVTRIAVDHIGLNDDVLSAQGDS
jgi:hypothetical protein